MTKEIFIKLINTISKFRKEEERWEKFGIPLYELPLSELSWDIFNILTSETFTTQGIDWINWWLFEKSDSFGDIQAWDENDKEIPTDTTDDLWELVKKYQK